VAAFSVLAAAGLLALLLPGGEEDEQASLPPPDPAPADLRVGTTVYGLPLEAPARLVRRFHRFPAEHVAAEGERVWVVGDNELARIDARSGRVRDDLAHFPVAEIWGLELAGGALWVLATDDPPDAGQALLFRVDPRTLGREQIQLGSDGALGEPSLAAAGDAVYVGLPRPRRGPRPTSWQTDTRKARVRSSSSTTTIERGCGERVESTPGKARPLASSPPVTPAPRRPRPHAGL